MNAAAKALAMSSMGDTRGWGLSFQMTREKLVLWVLFFAVLFCAFGLIYVKTVNRQLFSELQTSQQSYNDAQLRWGQLLLEQSTWATQARVEGIARSRLDMTLPRAKNIRVIREL